MFLMVELVVSILSQFCRQPTIPRPVVSDESNWIFIGFELYIYITFLFLFMMFSLEGSDKDKAVEYGNLICYMVFLSVEYWLITSRRPKITSAQLLTGGKCPMYSDWQLALSLQGGNGPLLQIKSAMITGISQ